MKDNKKEMIGKVVSDKRQKTITVLIERYKKHPLYSKRYKVSKKFSVHDEKEIAKVNDIVKIVETRPLSATKKFRLKKVIDAYQERIK